MTQDADTEKQRQRLINLLEELFQLDQPDLDFGFYKIMHANAGTVKKFLEEDLLRIIQANFDQAQAEQVEQAQKTYDAVIKEAKDYESPNPEETDPVREAKLALDQAKIYASNEADIYEHLHRFFCRYYNNGDFMSRRHFVRETAGKAAPYAIPYDGQEVLFHWANRDQYYIKSSEYLTNATFDVSASLEAQPDLGGDTPKLKLHCRLIDASEGEHNNNKATDDAQRFFLLCAEQPVVMDNGELVLQFEYRPDPKKPENARNWQKDKLTDAEQIILAALDEIPEAALYAQVLRTKVGEEKQQRKLLRKYLNKYTMRNTTDYFIHKDLGGFLRRELDFYIKNEVLRIDDIESNEPPIVQNFLKRIKLLRALGGQLITFLAQLENFQKKLWLKKKFVTETQYCVTLDRIPEEFYPEIIANEAQRAEWIALFAIDEIEESTLGPAFTKPLTLEFLKANPYLVLDTALFSEDFKDKLLATCKNLDATLDGVIVHSENFQALQLMQKKYQEQVQCVYIDPPYNTSSSEIIYKNGYKHSSWLSMIESGLSSVQNYMNETSVGYVAIDDVELYRLIALVKLVFGENNLISTMPVLSNPKGRDQKHIAIAHDYQLLFARHSATATLGQLVLDKENFAKKYPRVDLDGKRSRLLPLLRTGSASSRTDRPKMYFPILFSPHNNKLSSITNQEYQQIYANSLSTDSPAFNDDFVEELKHTYESQGYEFLLPCSTSKIYGRWRWGYTKCCKEIIAGNLVAKKVKTIDKSYKTSVFQFDDRAIPNQRAKSMWFSERYDATTKGTNLLKSLLIEGTFDFPKSIHTVEDCVFLGSDPDSIILDYFAGSGTTGHAVINLNREFNSNRKYIMVEMGRHFDTVLLQRMKKVVYAKDWKDGKPVMREGSSHAFKYIRLESYEDTLNNLRFQDNDARAKMLEIHAELRRGYMLEYWLDTETRGSQSLLSIEEFDHPNNYTLDVKKPGADTQESKTVDLIETFNWLIGLHVDHIDQWRYYHADFVHEHDPELTEGEETRLVLESTLAEDETGEWGFRKIEGKICTIPGDMDNTMRVIVIWRNLTGEVDKDNLMLDAWFAEHCHFKKAESAVVYVNGTNNLLCLKVAGDKWDARLIEAEFHQQMWDGSA